MADMKTYLEQNAYDPDSIITRSVKDPTSWDVVANAIISAIFDYLDLNRYMLKCTDYLYVGIEALWDDPYEEPEQFHLALPTTIKYAFSTMSTRDLTEAFLLPNANRLIRSLQKAGFDKPTMSSGVTVFVAEIKRQVLTLAKDIVLSEEPIMHHISVKNRRLNDDGSPFDAAVTEFVFRYNLKVDGLSDAEIDEKWKQSPWYKAEYIKSI